MEKDVITGIIILILAVLLLGITYAVNAFNLFSFLDKPITGEGLGPLCSSLSDCQNFCQTSRGRCESYCRIVPSSKMCDLIGIKEVVKNESK